MVLFTNNQTDGALLRRAVRDAAAFDELYRRYEPIVVAYLQRRTCDAELTADLTAETFSDALRNSHRFRDDGQPAVGWLLGISRHRHLRYIERRSAESRAIQRLGTEREAVSDASLERIEAVIDLDAAGNPFVAALADLPETQRDAIRAHVLDEIPYEALADQLGVSAATVRQRVRRGLRRIRAVVGEPTL